MRRRVVLKHDSGLDAKVDRLHAPSVHDASVNPGIEHGAKPMAAVQKHGADGIRFAHEQHNRSLDGSARIEIRLKSGSLMWRRIGRGVKVVAVP